LAHALAADACALKEVNLMGNQLKDRGTVALAAGIGHSKHLSTLNLSQNQFTGDEEVILALSKSFMLCSTLKHIDLDGNLLGNQGVELFLQSLSECTHIQRFKITPFVNPIHYKAIDFWAKNNKPKTKTKKKGKGKGKKRGKKRGKKKTTR
jgi:Ran GTPase-activating protein (RanGAP) involved in mRNA processing and transport